MSDAPRSSLDAAHQLAGQAVSYATAFLDGRDTPRQLAENTERLLLDLLTIHQSGPDLLLNPVRLLRCAMSHAALTAILGGDQTRLDLWQQLMASFVTLIQHEMRKVEEFQQRETTRR